MKITVKQFLERAGVEHWAASMVENIKPGEYMVFHNGYAVDGIKFEGEDGTDELTGYLIDYSDGDEPDWGSGADLLDVFELKEPDAWERVYVAFVGKDRAISLGCTEENWKEILESAAEYVFDSESIQERIDDIVKMLVEESEGNDDE